MNCYRSEEMEKVAIKYLENKKGLLPKIERKFIEFLPHPFSKEGRFVSIVEAGAFASMTAGLYFQAPEIFQDHAIFPIYLVIAAGVMGLGAIGGLNYLKDYLVERLEKRAKI